MHLYFIMRCIWCNVPITYYSSHEHATRQNCLCSESGYHEFATFLCCWRIFLRKPRTKPLLVRRREKRSNTI